MKPLANPRGNTARVRLSIEVELVLWDDVDPLALAKEARDACCSAFEKSKRPYGNDDIYVRHVEYVIVPKGVA